ncbi:YiiD C-terminal domain-containing protein [Parendozoicomonas sp. Alg238-R29]|uniref:PaaI family thioesterase n=1 Tax=Parendozoicomonas sp. Alg238-R29 TaxID=2993446 RepID=UPI00248F0BC4|nr:YiiD C-terminal domain-containing protein [Parendozoicomonas sp. Alg238-R29]
MKLTEDMLKGFAEEKIEFVKRSGLKVLDAKAGYVRCLMPAEGNGNHFGTMYAGAMFTLAEIPGGVMALACFEPGKYVPLLKNMSIKYLKPAKGDITFETLLAKDEINRIASDAQENGKADFILTGELKDSEGNVVAVTEGLYQVRSSI